MRRAHPREGGDERNGKSEALIRQRLISALVMALALLTAARPARAALEPMPSGGDPRLKIVGYDPLQVVNIHAALGYQIMIEFDRSERIENVAIGDSLGWQVIPNHKANLLFLKPMARVAATNMTVVTNLRHYTFELDVRPGAVPPGDPSVIYGLRFQYPPPAAPVIVAAPAPPPAPEAPKDVNHAYSYDGSPQNLPTRVFDDGQATYFRFAEGSSYPAIFAVEADKSEAVVNYHVRDGYVVIDRLARGFVLRRGKVETRIYNDGYQEPAPGPLSPRPRRK
jgi:type IV secretion system protein VirB9